MFEYGFFRRFSSRIPYGVLMPMLMIVAIGVLNISSAARATRPDLYLSQIARFGFAFFLMMTASLVHTRIIRNLSYVIYSGAIVLLVLVLVVGTMAKGAERWLVVGPLRLQPSDPAKLALVVAMARYCSLYWPKDGYSIFSLLRPLNLSRPLGFWALMIFLLIKDRHASVIFSDTLLRSKFGIIVMVGLLLVGLIWIFLSLLKLYNEGLHFEAFIAPVDIVLLPFFLIAVEPDLATGLVLLAVGGIMFLFIGIQRSSLIFGVIVALVLGVGAYFTVLKDYQRQRIVTFLNPDADLKGEGYQAMQSIIAIGSGQIAGKGLNAGTQTQLSFLPENATDFVFSVWAEEWGFVASLFLLSLYLMLLWSILKIVTKVDDQFSQLICVGVTSYIFLQVFVNVGMVSGLLPVAGVPLPLMSYGGSSLTITMIGIGLVSNVAIWRGEK